MVPAEQFTQVQVLEEGEIFGPVHFIVVSHIPGNPKTQANAPNHFRNPSTPLVALPDTQIDNLFYCPLHLTYALEKREHHSMGTLLVLQMP